MARKNDDKGFVPFTSTLIDPVSRAAAVNAGDAGHMRMRTATFSKDEAGLCGLWLQAWKNPRNNLWTVVRHESLPALLPENEEGPALTVRPQTNLQGDLYFFDALHYCASFEAVQKLAGVSETAARDDAPHYSAVAADAGVPLDVEGMPHPAAWGNILTGGHFVDQSFRTAAKTENRETAITDGENNETALAIIKPLSTPGAYASEQERLIADFEDRYERLAKLKEARLAAVELKNVVADAVEKSFGIVAKPNKDDAAFLGVMGAAAAGASVLVAVTGLWPMLAMTIPMTGACIGFGRHELKTKPAAKYQFDQKLQEAVWCTLGLSGTERKLLEDFTRAARGVYGLEHAAYVQAQVLEGKKGARHMKQGGAILDDTIKDMKMGREEAKALREAYNRNAFPAPGKFLETLERSCRQIEAAFDEKMTAIVKMELPPALPPGQNP